MQSLTLSSLYPPSLHSTSLPHAPVLLSVPIILGSVVYLTKRSTKKPLPPGPPGLPIIGNTLDLPNSFAWEAYGSLCDKYKSPIISVTALGLNVAIVDTYELAVELFDKRGSIYSGRPRLYMIADLLGWEKATFQLEPHRLRSARKLYHEEIGTPRVMETYWPLQEENARTFVQRCRQYEGNTVSLKDLCFQFSSTNLLEMTYGSADANIVSLRIKAMDILFEGATFLVNLFPILRFVPGWAPGGRFNQLVKEGKPIFAKIVEEPFNKVKQAMGSGLTKESLLSRWLGKANSPEEEDIAKHAAASLGTGLEMNAVTTQAFFLLLAAYPEVQRKLQAEMDSAVGPPSSGTSPSFQDRASLPYLEAVLKEVLRFHPSIPTGLPRQVSQDDIVGDYLLPKGTILFMNLWRMLRDPKTYTNPNQFNPERFLGTKPERDPKDIVFGFGRRFCPGKYVAHDALFITFAMIVSSLEVKPLANDDSASLLKKLRGPGQMINHPAPFELSITSRV